MCQQAGREGCTAHSSEHSAPVGNRVLVTGVDPCKGRRRVREPRSWFSAGLDLRKGGWHQYTRPSITGTSASHGLACSKGGHSPQSFYQKVSQTFPALPLPPSCLLLAPQYNPTEKSQHKVTHRRHKSVAEGGSGLRESHSLLPMLVKRPHSC